MSEPEKPRTVCTKCAHRIDRSHYYSDDLSRCGASPREVVGNPVDGEPWYGKDYDGKSYREHHRCYEVNEEGWCEKFKPKTMLAIWWDAFFR